VTDRLSFNLYKELKRRPATKATDHFLKQTDFIENYLDRVKIFRLEDGFEKVIAELERICNVKIKAMPRKMVSNRMYTVDNLTRNEKRIIDKLFREDFETFGYDRESQDNRFTNLLYYCVVVLYLILKETVDILRKAKAFLKR